MSFWDGGVGALGSIVGAGVGIWANHQESKYWANYNSPKEQMKRLSDAGLNPNLIYKDGASMVAGQSIGDPGAMAQQGISNAAASFVDKQLFRETAKANLKRTENESDKAAADANKSAAEAELAEQKAQTERIMQGIYESPEYQNQWNGIKDVRYAQAQMYASQDELNKANSATQQVVWERAKLELELFNEFGWKNAENESFIKAYQASMMKEQSEVNYEMLQLDLALKRSGIALNSAEMARFYSDVMLNQALTDSARANAKYIGQQTETEKWRGSHTKQQALWAKTKNYWMDKYHIDIDRYSNSQVVNVLGNGGTTTTTGDLRPNPLQPSTILNPTPTYGGQR